MALKLPTSVATETESKLILPGVNQSANPTVSPVSRIPSIPVVPQLTLPSFSGYGAASATDTYSGKPLAIVPTTIPKTFMNPQLIIPQIDTSRVATSFDPTVPQRLTRNMLTNGRMPESVSRAVKAKLGGMYNEQLDHAISLELSGSNQKSNLRLEPSQPGGVNTATDPMENALAKQVISGQVSLVDAQRQLAKAKGITLAEDKALNNPLNQWLLEHGTVLKTLAAVQGGIESAKNYVISAFQNPKETYIGAATAIENFGLGVAKLATQAAGTQPVVQALGGQKYTSQAAQWIQDNKDALNQIFKANYANTEDKKQAYETGGIVGSLVAYYLTGSVAGKVLEGTALKLLTEYGGSLTAKGVSQVGTAMENVGNLTGFLGTGQILHDPQDGSRAGQLKNDLITYALFEGVIRGIPAGLRAVFNKLKSGEKITLAEGEAAVAEANKVNDIKPEALKVESPKPETANIQPQLPPKMIETAPTESATTPPPKMLINNEIGQVPKSVPSGKLRPIEGIGETKTRGLSEGVLNKTISSQSSRLPGFAPEEARKLESAQVAQKISDTFGDIPEYKTMNVADQGARAIDLVEKDRASAKLIAYGAKAPPKGLTPEAVFVAVEQDALERGDIQTLKELANSRLTQEATTMGQRLRMLAERNPESPTEAIRSVQEARVKAVQDRLSGKKVETLRGAEANIQQTAIKKAMSEGESSKRPTWEQFINSITCNY